MYSNSETIEVEMDSCYTIVCVNVKMGDGQTIWVCKDASAYKRSLSKLKLMGHIKLIQHGPTQFQR